MADYTTEFEELARALRTLGLIQKYGEVLSIEVEADVDVGELLSAIERGEDPDLDTIESGDTVFAFQDEDSSEPEGPGKPKDVVNYAKSGDVNLLAVIESLAEDVNGHFYRLPSEDELDVSESDYQDLIVHIRSVIDTMESDTPVTLEVDEVGRGHSGSPREGTENEEMAGRGERRAESKEFLRQNRGEWVTAREYAAWSDVDREDEDTEVNIASAALHQLHKETDFPVVVKYDNRAKKYYKLPESDGDDEHEFSEPVVGSRPSLEGSAPYKTLVVLAREYDGEQGLTSDELAEVSDATSSAHDSRLRRLEEKDLVKRTQESKGKPGGGVTPVRWAPTDEGTSLELPAVDSSDPEI